ncbi:MAG TPA: cobalt-precorrin-6A reductase [Propionibacteriaceae bacterium]|nr:cobalt-precorrin-6A reductase [Propionibacteriaceae bacterium]
MTDTVLLGPDRGTVLVLGGTTEGRDLAARLLDAGVHVTSSLAGRVADVRPPPGEVRIGGFGGVAGLVDFLQSQAVCAVVDATHPFAERITAHATEACGMAGIPVLRVARPSWSTRPDAEAWHWVDSLGDARVRAEQLGRRVFLAIGRQDLDQFASWGDRYVLTRVITAPESSVPACWEVISARGPFRREDEVDLLRSRGIDALVTKDSGGPTTAKLDAAALLNVPVVVVRRPPVPAGLTTVDSVTEAVSWVGGIVVSTAG